MEIAAKAPAKINLCLSIQGKRSDNYHEVDMIMQTVNLFDTVTVKKSFEGNNIIKIICDKDIGCVESENIAFKASKKFFDCTGIKNPGILIKIQKKIPIFAGLAGGSSDGAAAIVCLNKMFETKLSQDEMREIGAEVGTDIPFCIEGGTARARGTGTKLEKIKNIPECGIVIVKPECEVSTKKAYEMYDSSKIRDKKNVQNMVNFINKGDLFKISQYLFNDFENFIQKPEIEQAKHEMLKSNPLGINMSGSGPSVFAIFENLYKAERCAKTLNKIFPKTYVCTPIPFGAKI